VRPKVNVAILRFGLDSGTIYARNFKFAMEVAPINRSNKIMLNKQWLPCDVIANFENYKLN